MFHELKLTGISLQGMIPEPQLLENREPSLPLIARKQSVLDPAFSWEPCFPLVRAIVAEQCAAPQDGAPAELPGTNPLEG